MAAFSSTGCRSKVSSSGTKIRECSCEQIWVASGGNDESLGGKSFGSGLASFFCVSSDICLGGSIGFCCDCLQLSSDGFDVASSSCFGGGIGCFFGGTTPCDVFSGGSGARGCFG